LQDHDDKETGRFERTRPIYQYLQYYNVNVSLEHVEELERLLDVNNEQKRDLTSTALKIVHNMQTLVQSYFLPPSGTMLDGARTAGTRLWNVCVGRSQVTTEETADFKKLLAEST
jgi:hypothetical protein